MCVASDGSYDVPEGLISSFPCRTDDTGNWSIVDGLEHDAFAADKIRASVDELVGERDTVANLLA